MTRQDGYLNAFTGAGMMGRDPFTATRFEGTVRDWTTGTRESDALFTHNGLAQRIITVPAEEALRAGWKITSQDIDEKVIEKLDSLQEDLGVKAVMSLALSWDRLFGGAAILLVADDGGTLEDPLKEEALRSIERLEVFSPQDIFYTSAHLYGDPLDENFGKPQFYNITSKWGNNFLVHESRLLLFYGAPITNERRRMRNGWGGTIIEQVRDELVRLGSSFDAARVAVERLSQSVLKFNGLASKMMNEQGENEVMKRLHVIDMGRHMLNTIAIDIGEEYAQHNLSVGGVREILETFETAVSAASGIPATILFGRSPAGMSATGKSDLEAYYDMVSRIQERVLRPQLSRLIYLLSKCSKSSVVLPEHWQIEFAPLWNPTEMEVATVEKTKADTRRTNADAMKILAEIGALDLTEIRNTLGQQSDFALDRSLDNMLASQIVEE